MPHDRYTVVLKFKIDPESTWYGATFESLVRDSAPKVLANAMDLKFDEDVYVESVTKETKEG